MVEITVGHLRMTKKGFLHFLENLMANQNVHLFYLRNVAKFKHTRVVWQANTVVLSHGNKKIHKRKKMPGIKISKGSEDRQR